MLQNSRYSPIKQKLLLHPLYAAIRDRADLAIFMETHVFAVWDFMSLAKRLQRDLTCINLPWMPVADKRSARLINEIILGEESDLDYDGQPASHLDMYLGAMREVGADTAPFEHFLEALRNGGELESAMVKADLPPHVRSFVRFNIDLAINGSTSEVASSFLYGREDAIPEMFTALLNSWNIPEAQAPRLFHYLHRHIELDGDEHGPAVRQILSRLVDGDALATQRAIETACLAVESRIALWNGVLATLLREKHLPKHAYA